MKVLEINVYNYRRGGSETVYFNTGEALAAHGHEVVRFALKWPENLPDENDGYFAESKATRRGVLRPLANIVTYFYHFEAARKLGRLIEKERPDIAQVHLIWGQLTPSILRVLKRHGVPVVLTAHDYRVVCPAFLFRNGRGEVCEQCEGHKFYKCVFNTCCKGSKGLSAMMAAEQWFRNTFFNPSRMVDGVLYVSDFCRDKHLQYMPALRDLPSARIYNSAKTIDAEVIPKPQGEPYYLYMGRLSDEKGVTTLVKAFGQLPEVRLRIAGTGPEEERLRQYVVRNEIGNVEFEGYRTGAALESLLRGARMVIVPSEWYENNPMTVIEAYATGTPVIGARIGGIPEIVEGGETGFVFEPGDVGSLRGAIERAQSLSADAYEAMRTKALAFARENFDSSRAYGELMEFFASVRNR